MYQVLDRIKVVFNGLVAFWSGLFVDLQASRQVFLKVSVNLHHRQTLSAMHCCQLDIKDNDLQQYTPVERPAANLAVTRLKKGACVVPLAAISC